MTYDKKERTLVEIFNGAKPLGKEVQAMILQMYVQKYGPITMHCESELDWSDAE